MKSQPRNKSFAVYPIEEKELKNCVFDTGYYAIGFEKRSAYIVGRLADNCEKRVGIDLQLPDIHSHSENLAFAGVRGDLIIKREALSLLKQNVLFPDSSRRPNEMKIFVDVSSMDRRTLSIVLYHLLLSCPARTTQIYVLYAPAKFTVPSRHLVPVIFSGPVNDLLGGEPKDPKFPTVMFVGLGYEVGLALGVVEAFEPARVFAYVPRGSDKRFDRQVDRVNLPLFVEGKYVDRVEYGVHAPANTFIDLKERILGVKDHARVVLVPLGPKLFSAISILCGYVYSPEICVWRVSSQINEETAQRHAEGSIAGFRLEVILSS